MSNNFFTGFGAENGAMISILSSVNLNRRCMACAARHWFCHLSYRSRPVFCVCVFFLGGRGMGDNLSLTSKMKVFHINFPESGKNVSRFAR